MAPIGKLYGYAEHGRTGRVLMAAKYNGLDLDLVVTNSLQGDTKKPEFIAQFPYGKIPAFIGSDGFVLTESRAIARYVAGLSDNAKLLGSDAKSGALVEKWLSFADDEIWNNMTGVFFLMIGRVPYTKPAEQYYWANLERAFTFLDGSLKNRTFLVGERVTLADLTVVSVLRAVFSRIAGPEFRAKYPNVQRHFTTVTNQPQLLDLFSNFEYLPQNIKYTPPKKDDKPKKEEKAKPAVAAAAAPKAKKAEKPKKAVKEEDDDDDDLPKPEPKPKNPLDDLPKSSFIMDEWKRTYSNKDTRKEALPWFYENFDYDGYSIWRFDYKYNDELTQIFMSSNLIGGLFSRLEASRKYVMGSAGVFGHSNESLIAGVVILRGKDWKPVLEVAPDMDSYDVTPLDIKTDDDKKFFEDMLAWEAEIGGKAWADGKVLK